MPGRWLAWAPPSPGAFPAIGGGASELGGGEGLRLGVAQQAQQGGEAAAAAAGPAAAGSQLPGDGSGEEGEEEDGAAAAGTTSSSPQSLRVAALLSQYLGGLESNGFAGAFGGGAGAAGALRQILSLAEADVSIEMVHAHVRGAGGGCVAGCVCAFASKLAEAKRGIEYQPAVVSGRARRGDSPLPGLLSCAARPGCRPAPRRSKRSAARRRSARGCCCWETWTRAWGRRGAAGCRPGARRPGRGTCLWGWTML